MSSEVLSRISDLLHERLNAKVSHQRRDGEGDSIVVRREQMPATRIEHVQVIPDQTFFLHERINSVLRITTTMSHGTSMLPPAYWLGCPGVLSMFTRPVPGRIATFSRLPVFDRPEVLDRVCDLAVGVVSYQAPILKALIKEHTQRIFDDLHAVQSRGYTPEAMREIYDYAQSGLHKQGYTVVPLQDGLVVFRAEDGPASLLQAPRIECRQHVRAFVGACLALELVFPMDQSIQKLELERIASALRCEDTVASDHTYGVGAWSADFSRHSVNYRITLPQRPEWSFPPEALVQNLTLRWQMLAARNGKPAIGLNSDCPPTPLTGNPMTAHAMPH